ncbi:hypothetical protein Zmor_027767 [Zophobas morio]|uniref:Cytochrome P450 n=1 Tax=Zophobas morio TaxID=2755281 RepID=A0AA38HNW1_9CUCU|nr:hypothetical protein Zmor_027767 [Zophobas morio]
MFVLLVVLAVVAVYYFLKLNYRYWEKRGVVGPKPNFLVGNLGKSFILKASPGEIFADVYNQYGDAEMVGMFRATTPILLVRDPALVREVTVKSFNSFRENDYEVSKKHDPIFGRNPFVLKGEEWKVVRSQLTPGFTSGKMKWLYPYLVENSKNLATFIQNCTENTDAKDICRRFTLNNVASCAFGLEGKCLEEENSEFRQLAKDFFSPATGFFLMTVSPPLSKLLSVSFIKKEMEKKFIQIVRQVLQYREENNVVRNDYLHVVSQLKQTEDFKFTDEDVTAHAAGFFGEGYETSSILMSFVLFELAANLHVQEKLREEVRRVYEENGNELPYEVLQALPYLDGVINETLRIHPPMFSLQKICTEDFNYGLRNGKQVTIEKGTPIILPVYGLHHDPKYYEDPKVFKPERFVGENKEKLTKYTFIPFGEGPRICLGKRFGVLQIKVGIAYVILNYSLSVGKKTQLPIRYDPINIMTVPVGGLWINFSRL